MITALLLAALPALRLAAAQDVTVTYMLSESPSKGTVIDALSGDGQVAYGKHWSKLARWTQDGAIEPLVSGVSISVDDADDADDADAVVVGNKDPEPGCGNVGNAYRWSEATGLVQLDCDGGFQTNAQGVSSDGTTVVVHRGFWSAPDYAWTCTCRPSCRTREPWRASRSATG